MEKMAAGHRRFQETRFEDQRELFECLDRQQNPQTLVVSCYDSRVNPALITDADPGDLLLVRNVANLIPPYTPDEGHHGTSAALELAIMELQVAHLVVMGHSNCGGVRALIDFEVAGKKEGVFVPQWMSIAREACHGLIVGQDEITREMARMVEQRVVRISLSNLLSFPFVQTRVKDGLLSLHGWWFEIGTGRLYAFDQNDESFNAL